MPRQTHPEEASPQHREALRWLHFLTRFGLWFGGFSMILLGCGALLGLEYKLLGIDPDAAYMMYKALKITDCVYGLMCVGLGLLCIMTRFRLANFRRKAPVLLYWAHTLLILLPLLHSVAAALCVQDPLSYVFPPSFFLRLLALAISLPLQMIYFKKRRPLFIH